MIASAQKISARQCNNQTKEIPQEIWWKIQAPPSTFTFTLAIGLFCPFHGKGAARQAQHRQLRMESPCASIEGNVQQSFFTNPQ
jgi:hypothetical protein